jgi:hypothetical protein
MKGTKDLKGPAWLAGTFASDLKGIQQRIGRIGTDRSCR